MLAIDNLHVAYKKEKEILKGVNLLLSPGKVHGLIGFNGAGKTTLLNTLYRFISPEKGVVSYNSLPVSRKDMAYLEAENYFYPYMTGEEYLNLFSSGKNAFSIEKWAELFHLPLKEITDGYSTGMRKKLALLGVLKQQKSILILDEPFNGLDLESVEILTRIIDQLRTSKRTILITSHIFETLTKCCDEIHYLADGVIRKSYLPDEYSLLAKELSSAIHRRTDDLMSDLL